MASDPSPFPSPKLGKPHSRNSSITQRPPPPATVTRYPGSGPVSSVSTAQAASPQCPDFVSDEQKREIRKLAMLGYAAIGFVLFNLLYGAVLYFTSPAFHRLFWSLPVFFVIYALSLICVPMALRDGKPNLLYPVMVGDFKFYNPIMASDLLLLRSQHAHSSWPPSWH